VANFDFEKKMLQPTKSKKKKTQATRLRRHYTIVPVSVRIAAPLAVVFLFLFAFYVLILFTDEIYVASFIISFHLFTQVNNRKTKKNY